ncbi:hypothetical protein JW848_05345 [Candidatus Bipolaricaulota bacterium]|nr:hypothetical protein [Candidatus Bipolaricaulota bacterium]
MRLEGWLFRIARWAGWLLLPLVLLQFLTGYAILHPRIFAGLIGKVSAFRGHAEIQVATMVLFVVHCIPYCASALRRIHVWRRLSIIVPAALGLGLIGFVAYLYWLG